MLRQFQWLLFVDCVDFAFVVCISCKDELCDDCYGFGAMTYGICVSRPHSCDSIVTVYDFCY